MQSVIPLLELGAWIPLPIVGAALQAALLGRLRLVSVAVATPLGRGIVCFAQTLFLYPRGWGLQGAVAAAAIGQALTTVVLLTGERRGCSAHLLPTLGSICAAS